MSKEYHAISKKRCCTCIQWTGERTVDKNGIKTDANSEAICLVYHKKVKGSFQCEQYFPLK